MKICFFFTLFSTTASSSGFSYLRISPLSLFQWHAAVPSWVYTTVCVGRTVHEWVWWAWVFRHLVTHTVIFCWEGCPMKIKPASILASIQSREAQWTQAPDRDTDALPRITGHGPVAHHGQSLCCFNTFTTAITSLLQLALHAQNLTATCTSEGNNWPHLVINMCSWRDFERSKLQ